MATCASVDANNFVVVNTTPPDSCTGFIIQSVSDWQSQQTPLWQLTPEQGSEIAGTILVVLAVAYVFRLLIRALNTDEISQSE